MTGGNFVKGPGRNFKERLMKRSLAIATDWINVVLTNVLIEGPTLTCSSCNAALDPVVKLEGA